MSENKGTKESKKDQLRWLKPMSWFMMGLLAEEVKKGNRPNNSFRTSSYTYVAETISEKFGVECHTKHVDNHLKTLRSSWNIISLMRGESGFGWEDNLKMITADPSVYNDVKAHPTCEKYRNQNIEMYDELAIIVGKDLAHGNFAKSLADTTIDSHTQVGAQEGSIEVEDTTSKGKEIESSTATSSKARSHRKRKLSDDGDDVMLTISNQIGEVAAALKRFSEDRIRR